MHEQDAASSLDQDATFHWQCADSIKKCSVSAAVATSNLVSPCIPQHAKLI
jgi:hypothetical protein